MSEIKRWAIIKVVDNVLILFRHCWDNEEDLYRVSAECKSTIGEIGLSIMVEKPLSQEQFDDYCCDEVGRKLISQVTDFGYEPDFVEVCG